MDDSLRPADGWSACDGARSRGAARRAGGVGALLRHRLVSLEWHLLAAGAVIIQTVLGGAVWLMMLVGPPSAAIWLTLTVAHVVVGTSALLAGVRLAAW